MSDMKTGRLESLDVARGFDMLWISGLSALVVSVCKALGFGPETAVACQMEHPAWHGFHFIDLVFPTFIFIAGVSFPFSLAKQHAQGMGKSVTAVRIVKRMVILFLLGLVYNGILQNGPTSTVYGSVLGRIGLAWGCAALLTVFFCSRVRAFLAVLALLLYWGIGVWVSAPDHPGADPLSMEGCLAGWIDRRLLPGRLTVPGVISYQGVLSTLPAVVTSLLGVFTGEYIRSSRFSGEHKSLVLLLASAFLLISGLLIAFGCGPLSFPLNKILWSPSFTLVAAAYSLFLFAVCYFLIDVKGWWRRTLFFRVIGVNALTIYLVQRIIGFRPASSFLFGWASSMSPAGWSHVVVNVGYVFVCWFFLYVLYRKSIFIKV